MKMSNRWRADHTPLLMELTGCTWRGRAIACRPETERGTDRIACKLERRRYTIERGLIERRFGSAQSQNIPDWDELSDDQKNSERSEAARLPEIMARLGIQLHPVRPMRLYGKWLASAPAEVEQVLTCCFAFGTLQPDRRSRRTRGSAHLPRALSLCLHSVSGFSRREEPREFWLRKPQEPAPRPLLS
jgi:hypothetical protein